MWPDWHEKEILYLFKLAHRDANLICLVQSQPRVNSYKSKFCCCIIPDYLYLSDAFTHPQAATSVGG